MDAVIIKRALAGVALRGQMGRNWSEVARVAQLPEYRNLDECKALLKEVADELKIRNPLDSD